MWDLILVLKSTLCPSAWILSRPSYPNRHCLGPLSPVALGIHWEEAKHHPTHLLCDGMKAAPSSSQELTLSFQELFKPVAIYRRHLKTKLYTLQLNVMLKTKVIDAPNLLLPVDLTTLYYYLCLRLFTCYLRIVEILCKEVPLRMSCQLQVQWHHVVSLKLIMVKIFTPRKSAYARNQGLICCFVDYLDFREWWEMLILRVKLKRVSDQWLLHCRWHKNVRNYFPIFENYYLT